MKKPEQMASGYTKTQTVIALFTLFAGTLMLMQSTNAADWIQPNSLVDAPLIGKEYIRPPEESIIMLSEEEVAENRAKLRQEQLQAEPVGTVYMMASAYNSVPGQTDASPYRTAIGSLTRDGVIASNYFPIGTKLRIPDHFGDQVFRVEDRMNPRYHKTLDIWMEEIPDAKQWGRRYIKVEIVKYGLGRGVE